MNEAELVVRVFRNPVRVWVEDWTFMTDYQPVEGREAVAVEIVPMDSLAVIEVLDKDNKTVYSKSMPNCTYEECMRLAEVVNGISIFMSLSEHEVPIWKAKVEVSEERIRMTLMSKFH
ncbi:hypothetical protein D3C76_25470 [compost metagenome]